MWYVYILKHKNSSKIYIGSTNNLKHRIKEHSVGKVKATKNLRPLYLQAYIAVSQEKIARKLEKYLKTGSGRAFLHKRILTDEALA